MSVIDPFSAFGRNDSCWCASGRKYKICHGALRAPSLPGDPVPPDDDKGIWIAPQTKVMRGVFESSVPPGGVPIYAPRSRPSASPEIVFPGIRELIEHPRRAHRVDPSQLGKLRFDAFASCGIETLKDAETASEARLADIADVVVDMGFCALESLHSARLSKEPPAVIFNTDTDIEKLLAHTMLWSHHVAVPDLVFDRVVRQGSYESIRDALVGQFKIAEIMRAGLVIPVPDSLLSGHASSFIAHEANGRINSGDLLSWVRSQLVLEGPTAKEAILVSAQDDLYDWPMFRLHSRVTNVGEDGVVETMMLHPYDSEYDYNPWISQVKDESASKYIHEVSRDLFVAESVGGSFVTRSPFRARILNKINYEGSPAQSALWTSAPLFGSVNSVALAKVALQEDSIRDLRKRVSIAISRCSSYKDQAEEMISLAAEIDHQSTVVAKKIDRSRILGGMGVVLGLGSVAIGSGGTGGLLLAAAGAISALKDSLPIFEKISENRLEAPWVFYTLRKNSKGKHRK